MWVRKEGRKLFIVAPTPMFCLAHRGEQDVFFQVGSRIENTKFIIMKSSKNQEIPPHVFKEESNINNCIPKNFKSSKNQDISNTFSWYQARIKNRDTRFKDEAGWDSRIDKINRWSSAVLSPRLFISLILAPLSTKYVCAVELVIFYSSLLLHYRDTPADPVFLDIASNWDVSTNCDCKNNKIDIK